MKAPTVRELPTMTSRHAADATGAWIALLVTAAFVGLWAGTQYFAHRLGYHDNLGPILYRVPSQFSRVLLMAALACAACGLVLLPRSRTRRLATPLLLAGVALFVVRLGPVYSPFQLLRWARAYAGVAELGPIVSNAQRLAVVTAIVFLLGGLAVVGSRRRRTASIFPRAFRSASTESWPSHRRAGPLCTYAFHATQRSSR